MNKNSNKIRFYPRTSKQTKNSKLITPQETKTEKSNLFTQNNNSNSNFKLPESIDQTNKEIKTTETNNNEMFILDNNNQIIKNQQNDDINLKRLITPNDAENITFINTLLKLKQKIIQNKKANGNNNNISRHNESLTNIEDKTNLSNIKECKTPKENINSKQLQLQVNDNLISSLQTHNLINKKNSNHNSFVFSDPLQKGENQLSYVQNNSFGNSFTNYGASPNTTVANYNKYSGLKTKDLIEITNRRKMMTESNLDSHVNKKGFDEIKKEGIKNDMDYKKFVFKPFTSQINSRSNQMTNNNNNQDLNIVKTNKEISNEITHQETNNIYSNKNEKKFSPSFNNTNQFINMTISNPLCRHSYILQQLRPHYIPTPFSLF